MKGTQTLENTSVYTAAYKIPLATKWRAGNHQSLKKQACCRNEYKFPSSATAYWTNACKVNIFITKKETCEVRYKTDLFVFFGHPLVPAVEHFQPFWLPLPQHISWDFFSTVQIGDIVTDKSKLFAYTVSLPFITEGILSLEEVGLWLISSLSTQET